MQRTTPFTFPARFFWPAMLCLGMLLAGCEGDDADDDFDQETARTEIDAATERFEDYVARQEFDSLMTLFTDDAIVMPQGAPMQEGAAIRDGFRQMMEAGVSEMELETIDVEVDGHTAYQVGRYSILVPSGMEVDRGKFLTVFQYVDGDWKIHRDIYNSDSPIPASMDGVSSDTTMADTSMAAPPPGTTVSPDPDTSGGL